MLTIVTALYCEAWPFIQYYNLKKDINSNKFQIFQNEWIQLIITNIGSIAASVGVSYLSTLHPPKQSDILVNIGVCGTRKHTIPTGSLYLCNKITEEATERSFFPDILYQHPFQESELITCNNVVTNQNDNNREVKLFDMEAAGIYQAASYFYQPQQMFFIKMVSDHGENTSWSPDYISGIIQKNMDSIVSWLELLQRMQTEDMPLFTKEEESAIFNLVKNLQCTVTMEYQLRQHLCYYKLIHGSFLEVIMDFCKGKTIPCKTKLEGKRYVEELRKKLI